MAENCDKTAFKEREFRGSRLRCLLATHLPKSEAVSFLNHLVRPFASVDMDDHFMPQGFCQPEEAKLGEATGFLDDQQRVEVTRWWLAESAGANTPNWDIVSTCKIGEQQQRGLILIEAKAHADELNPNDACGASPQNRRCIVAAIDAANAALNSMTAGKWELSPESHYQLSNRFAWAWEIASLGRPVILVYLGFLNAREMPRPFTTPGDWDQALLRYAAGKVPQNAWNSSIDVNGTPLTPLIRSADINISRPPGATGGVSASVCQS